MPVLAGTAPAGTAPAGTAPAGTGSRAVTRKPPALPFQAWNRLVAIPFNPVASAYPWTVTGAWMVFGAWAPAAGILAVLVVGYRDV